MKKSEIHYRYTDKGITVSRPKKFSLDFDGAVAARHTKYGIDIYPGYGHTIITVDERGIKHYH